MKRKIKVTKISSADRACGIATYDAGDRAETEKYEEKIEWVKVAAVDDEPGIQHDPKRTLTTIAQDDLDSWHKEAKLIAKKSDIVVLEYEHGIDHPTQQGYVTISEDDGYVVRTFTTLPNFTPWNNYLLK